MTTERMRLSATTREGGKKGVLGGLRRAGQIPAILYGQGLDPAPLAVNAKEVAQVIKASGVNALIELQWSAWQKKEPLVVMIKEMQTEVLHQQIIHLDLLKVDMKAKVTVTVPIRLTGKAVGVIQGGVIDQPTRDLEVKCLPGNIPEVIEIDITSLNIGDSIHLKDLKLPEGVETAQETSLTIVSVVAPRKEEPAAEAAAAPAEGAVAPAAEGGAAATPATTEAATPKKEEKEDKGKK